MSTVKHFPVLLPKDTDMTQWAVIACDQYTTDKNYWHSLEKFVGDAPSTLNLIFPEIYLSENVDKRISSINSSMEKYVSDGIFRSLDCFVMTERTLPDGRKRVGLVASVDLEEYDYTSPVGTIRPTEETIEERLPVRIHIRENAPLELPHILLLMDDSDKKIIEPIYKRKNDFEKLYDFDLNMNGGHICGYAIPFNAIPAESFDALLSPALQQKKYGKNAGILFAVGDGNHSMATAKKCWDKIKLSLTDEQKLTHPARFALVEILNVYDDALDFLPIHRVVLGINPKKLGYLLNNIIAVQSCLEKLRSDKNIRIEYVHEDEQVMLDAKNNNGIGIIMPYFPKNMLFNYVVNYGKLPKKAFSIGEEKTKKYYIEAKKIQL